MLATYDVSTPETPQELQVFAADGIDLFDLRFQVPYAVGFGAKLSVLDLSNPAMVVPRGSADTLAMTGIVNGTHAYGLGFEGLDAWDITDPDNPSHINSLDIDTFLAAATATVDGGALMLTNDGPFRVPRYLEPGRADRRGKRCHEGERGRLRRGAGGGHGPVTATELRAGDRGRDDAGDRRAP